MDATYLSPRRTWWVRSRAWLGILILIPFAVLTLTSPPPGLQGSWANLRIEAIGWLIFVSGAAMRWWATLYIGGRKLNTLVCEGPYSLCRNPLYFGTWLMGVSVAVFLESLTFAVGMIVASVVYLSITVPAEEILLRQKLGKPYDDYCRQVPRLFPRLRGFRTPATITVNVSGLKAEAVRAARWIWIPIICELITHLRTQEWWPRVLNLP